MAAFSSIATAAALAITAATSAYTVVSSENAKNDAKEQAANEKKEQDAALSALETEKKQKEQQDSAVRQNADQTRAARRRYQGTLGRGSTILTSPLGVSSGAPPSGTVGGGTAKKTILGA